MRFSFWSNREGKKKDNANQHIDVCSIEPMWMSAWIAIARPLISCRVSTNKRTFFSWLANIEISGWSKFFLWIDTSSVWDCCFKWWENVYRTFSLSSKLHPVYIYRAMFITGKCVYFYRKRKIIIKIWPRKIIRIDFVNMESISIYLMKSVLVWFIIKYLHMRSIRTS
jgi:hypothetical protein